MFQFVPEPTAWIDVEWKDLDEGGFERANTIRMQVVLVPGTEIMTETQEVTGDFIRRVSRDWSQILGADQKPWPFTAENLNAMIERAPGFVMGFVRSYILAWNGKGKVREKNSNASHAAGPAGEGTPKRRARASKSS